MMDSIKFVNFFNSLLKPDINNSRKEDDDEYVDLNNYIFRWKYYLDNIDLKIEDDEFLTKNDVEELDRFLKNFFNDVSKNSKLEDYLKEKKREYKNFKSKLNSAKVDCIVIKDCQNNDDTKVKSIPITPVIEDNVLMKPEIDEEIAGKSLKYVQELLKIEGELIEDKMKELLIIILSDKNQQLLNNFCKVLAENLAEKDSEKSESKLIIFSNVLSNLSSTQSSSLIT